MGASRRLLPPLLAFALARATTHDLFVDGAPPPIVATLPLLIDGAREAVELAVREGDDVAALLGAVTPRLSADNVDQVTSALYLRAAKGGHTVARRWWAVAARPGPATRGGASAVWRTALSAAAASRPGAGVVVATDGFALGEDSRAALGALRAGRAAPVATAEWVGPSAILAAAVAAAPDRAIVAAPPWGAAVRGDVFVDYERLARATAAPPRRLGGRWPAACRGRRLVADAESWKRSAPRTEATPSRAASPRGSTTSARATPPRSTRTSSTCGRGPRAAEPQRLSSAGADLARPEPQRPVLDRHERDRRGERGHAVAASLCLYDDDRFLAPCSRTSSRAHAVVVHHALEPWFGAPRRAAGRGGRRGPRGGERAMSVVVGDWPTEEAQRNSGSASAALPCAPSHVLLVDGDEFWHPVELDRALALVADAERGGRRVGWARAAMATYFKSAASEDRTPLLRDAATARCHPYVRAELEAKVASFAHARDVVDGWVDDVGAYDAGQDKGDATSLRPHEAPAPLGPAPALRRLSLDARRRSRDRGAHRDDALPRAAPRRAASTSARRRRPTTGATAPRRRPPSTSAATRRGRGGPTGPGRFERRRRRRGAAAGVQLDPSPGAPTCGAGGRPRFLVVVIGEGELDGATEGVFADAAASPRRAPRRRRGRGLADDGSEVGFAAARGWPNPNASALYNFEQANAVAARRGLRAAHVPLGAAPGLGDGAGALAGPRPVDVLFVGKLNGRRRNILRALRYDHGLRVLHGNADGPLFGEPLKAALQGAKVVLSLRFFDDDREWKMTRFPPAVAAGAVVVAEPGGAPAEQAAWAGAVHFAAGGVSGLARAIRAYLDDDAADAAAAARHSTMHLIRAIAFATAAAAGRVTLGTSNTLDMSNTSWWRLALAAPAISPDFALVSKHVCERGSIYEKTNACREKSQCKLCRWPTGNAVFRDHFECFVAPPFDEWFGFDALPPADDPGWGGAWSPRPTRPSTATPWSTALPTASSVVVHVRLGDLLLPDLAANASATALTSISMRSQGGQLRNALRVVAELRARLPGRRVHALILSDSPPETVAATLEGLDVGIRVGGARRDGASPVDGRTAGLENGFDA
ncbi:hypothetical protein JL720_6624 [Aureococcus anophagefferens]|nr:hypothetical protein JL720_6624 [Aureococcus anophagefferens]